MSGIECIHTAEIVCPWCSHEHDDSWEMEEDEDTRECYGCGRPFTYVRDIEVTYTTYKETP